MPIDDAALAAAMDKGIADAAPTPTPTPAPTPTGGNDDAQHAGNDGSETQVSSAEPAQPNGEGTGAADGEGVGAPDGDAQGDDKADGAGTAATPVGEDGKPVAPAGAKPDGDAPPVDPLERALNDPIPNALKKETKERIQTLAGKVRELVPALEERNRDIEALMNPILETGATPVQYKQSLEYLRLVNSPSRADKEKALEIMQGEIVALATMLGKPVPGVNFLEGHDDLIQAVGSGKMTREHAIELAAARAAQGYQQKTEQRLALERQSGEEQARAVGEGRAALNALEVALKGSDPHYMNKKAILIQQLRPVFQRIHPSEWAATFRRAYDALPAPAPRPAPPPSTAANPSAASRSGGGNTPLRASNPAGAPVKPPASLEEAIDFGIRSAGR